MRTANPYYPADSPFVYVYFFPRAAGRFVNRPYEEKETDRRTGDAAPARNDRSGRLTVTLVSRALSDRQHKNLYIIRK